MPLIPSLPLLNLSIVQPHGTCSLDQPRRASMLLGEAEIRRATEAQLRHRSGLSAVALHI